MSAESLRRESLPLFDRALDHAAVQSERLLRERPGYHPMYTVGGKWGLEGERWTHWCEGFFPGILQRTEYIEGYAIAPLADRMLAADAELKRQFDAKLAADPAFAADADARLAWFYERTPYYDERYRLDPSGRE